MEIKLDKYFDNIYMLYINDHELDRAKHKMESHSIKVEYFHGVDGKKELYEIFADYLERNQNDRPKTFMKTVGAFGHAHSFIKLIEDAINKNYKKILILEPDIYFALNFNTLAERFLKMQYKILYLGASQHDWIHVDKNYNGLLKDGHYIATNTCGTFAIALDCSILKEYLGILRKLLNPSDICLYELHKKYKHECMVIYPNVVICDVTKSSTTSRWRNQMLIAKKFRWSLDYDIHERYTFDVNTNSFYKVFIEVNYHEPGIKGSFRVSDGMAFITPKFVVPDLTITEKKNKIIDNNPVMGNNYIFYVIPKQNKVYVYIENFFVDNIYFFEYYKNVNSSDKETCHLIKTKLLKYSISKDKMITNYYNKLVKNL